MTHAELVSQCGVSQTRLERLISHLTDVQAREPSALPGWSRGHVITHLARSADGLNRFVDGVQKGVDAEMYPGGPDARAAAIEEGAARPMDLMRADTAFSGHRLLDSLAGLAEDQLDTPLKWRKPITARELPVFRWRELEIHLVDLDLGYTTADWPDEFVGFNLERELAALPQRAPDVTPPVLRDHELLAWLVGRLSGAGLPELPAWP